MTTATTTPTLAATRDRLQGLLKAATEYAAAADRMQRLAEGFLEREDDWLVGVDSYGGAVDGQIRAALHDVQHPEEMIEPSQLCGSIQEAIDVLTFAIERDDRVR